MNKSLPLKLFMGAALMGSTFTIPVEAVNPVEECSKELLLSYFPEGFVRETLKKYNVPQDKWDAIVKELNEKDKEVVKIVEERAAKVNPNPLKDPQQRHEAVKIFKETLTDIFSTTLKKNGVSDTTQMQQMLDDIQQQKAKRFAQCMEQQRTQNGQTPPAGASQGAHEATAQTHVPATRPETVAPDSLNKTATPPAAVNVDDSDDDNDDDEDNDDDNGDDDNDDSDDDDDDNDE